MSAYEVLVMHKWMPYFPSKEYRAQSKFESIVPATTLYSYALSV